MREPLIPRQGDEVKASTIADIIHWVRSAIPRGDGKTVRVKTTNGGSTISSIGGGNTLIYCKLTSHIEGSMFGGDIYPDMIQTVPGTYDNVISGQQVRVINLLPAYVASLTFPSDFYIVTQMNHSAEAGAIVTYPAGLYYTVQLDVWR